MGCWTSQTYSALLFIALNQPTVAFVPLTTCRRQTPFRIRLEMSYLDSLAVSTEDQNKPAADIYVEGDEWMLYEQDRARESIATSVQVMATEEQEMSNVRVAALKAAVRFAEEAEFEAEYDAKVAANDAAVEAADAEAAVEALLKAEAEVEEARAALYTQLKVEAEEDAAEIARSNERVKQAEARASRATLFMVQDASKTIIQIPDEPPKTAEKATAEDTDAERSKVEFADTAARKSWCMGFSVVDSATYNRTLTSLHAPAALNGLWVFAVREGSAADQAELQPMEILPPGRVVSGERLVAIGENSIKWFEDFESALNQKEKGEELEIILEGVTGERRQVVLCLPA